MTENELKERAWSTPQDLNNQFYQGTSLPITTASSIAYDLNQYTHNQIPKTFNNQSQQVPFEERPSKKVQFARQIQQQGSPKIPLTGTQSWHEPSSTNNDLSGTIMRQEPLSTRQSGHRTIIPTSNISSSHASVQKPIYVGIDHRATLAERGQTTTHKHHHKNGDKTNSDGPGSMKNNHRTRSHTHHQHKNQETNNVQSSRSNIQSNKPLEPLQVKLSSTHRSGTTNSTSTIIVNKQVHQGEQPIFNDIEMKVPKTRGKRQAQSQQIEQQTTFDNEIKPSKNKGNHSQQRQPHHRHHSPQRTETTRRLENRHQGTPIMRIPISQQQQQQRHKQLSMSSPMISPPTITRTRV
jgi:hypothetical protein